MLTHQIVFEADQRSDGGEQVRHPAGFHVGTMIRVVALLMKMMAMLMRKVMFSVKLSLQASGQRFVFLLLRQANRRLLIVADDDLLRCW